MCGGGQKVTKMFDKISKTRDRLRKKKDEFYKKLNDIILERDITPDKLRNASELIIDLPKFCGYDGKIDFFTFKSEFKKLVEPRLQKKYYADYLKRNYLCGQALIMVEKEPNYEKIWDRLQLSFGNSRILLQNKLSLIENFGISNVKGDKKIATNLANLINIMKDLSTLAIEHDIEGQLYEGVG